MLTLERYHAKAAEYAELAKTASGPEEAREFQQREHSFTALADDEQWFVDHHDQTVHPRDADGADRATPVLIADAAVKQ